MPSAGWTCEVRGSVWGVTDKDATAGLAILHTGDQVLSVNGHRLTWLGPWLPLAKLSAGDPYTLAIRRDEHTLYLPLRMAADTPVSVLDVAATLGIAWLLVLAGLWMRLGGPGNATARLGSAAFLCGGIAMIAPVLHTFPTRNITTIWFALILMRITRPLQMVLGWDFLSRFPHPFSEGPAVRIMRGCFYTAAAMLWAGANLPVIAELIGLPNIPVLNSIEWLSPDGPNETLRLAIFDGCISAAVCYVLVRNYALSADRDSRRRIRWAAGSFGIGSDVSADSEIA